MAPDDKPPVASVGSFRGQFHAPDARTINESHMVLTMSEEYLQAVESATRNQFAIPAEEKTKQEKLRQAGETWRSLIVEVPRLIALVGFLVSFVWRYVEDKQPDMVLIAIILAILAGPKSIEVLQRALKRAGVLS